MYQILHVIHNVKYFQQSAIERGVYVGMQVDKLPHSLVNFTLGVPLSKPV